MSNARHIIGRIAGIIEYNNPDSYNKNHVDYIELVKYKLPGAIEEELNRFESDGEHIVIDKIYVDLETIESLSDFDFIEQFRIKFRNELQKKLNGVESKPEYNRLTEVFIFYLKNAHFPWWYSDESAEGLSRILRVILAGKNEMLVGFIRNNRNHSEMIQRLIICLESDQKRKLLNDFYEGEDLNFSPGSIYQILHSGIHYYADIAEKWFRFAITSSTKGRSEIALLQSFRDLLSGYEELAIAEKIRTQPELFSNDLISIFTSASDPSKRKIESAYEINIQFVIREDIRIVMQDDKIVIEIPLQYKAKVDLKKLELSVYKLLEDTGYLMLRSLLREREMLIALPGKNESNDASLDLVKLISAEAINYVDAARESDSESNLIFHLEYYLVHGVLPVIGGSNAISGTPYDWLKQLFLNSPTKILDLLDQYRFREHIVFRLLNIVDTDTEDYILTEFFPQYINLHYKDLVFANISTFSKSEMWKRWIAFLLLEEDIHMKDPNHVLIRFLKAQNIDLESLWVELEISSSGSLAKDIKLKNLQSLLRKELSIDSHEKSKVSTEGGGADVFNEYLMNGSLSIHEEAFSKDVFVKNLEDYLYNISKNEFMDIFARYYARKNVLSILSMQAVMAILSHHFAKERELFNSYANQLKQFSEAENLRYSPESFVDIFERGVLHIKHVQSAKDQIYRALNEHFRRTIVSSLNINKDDLSKHFQKAGITDESKKLIEAVIKDEGVKSKSSEDAVQRKLEIEDLPFSFYSDTILYLFDNRKIPWWLKSEHIRELLLRYDINHNSLSLDDFFRKFLILANTVYKRKLLSWLKQQIIKPEFSSGLIVNFGKELVQTLFFLLYPEKEHLFSKLDILCARLMEHYPDDYNLILLKNRLLYACFIAAGTGENLTFSILKILSFEFALKLKGVYELVDEELSDLINMHDLARFYHKEKLLQEENVYKTIQLEELLYNLFEVKSELDYEIFPDELIKLMIDIFIYEKQEVLRFNQIFDRELIRRILHDRTHLFLSYIEISKFSFISDIVKEFADRLFKLLKKYNISHWSRKSIQQELVYELAHAFTGTEKPSNENKMKQSFVRDIIQGKLFDQQVQFLFKTLLSKGKENIYVFLDCKPIENEIADDFVDVGILDDNALTMILEGSSGEKLSFNTLREVSGDKASAALNHVYHQFKQVLDYLLSELTSKESIEDICSHIVLVFIKQENKVLPPNAALYYVLVYLLESPLLKPITKIKLVSVIQAKLIGKEKWKHFSVDAVYLSYSKSYEVLIADHNQQMKQSFSWNDIQEPVDLPVEDFKVSKDKQLDEDIVVTIQSYSERKAEILYSGFMFLLEKKHFPWWTNKKEITGYIKLNLRSFLKKHTDQKQKIIEQLSKKDSCDIVFGHFPMDVISNLLFALKEELLSHWLILENIIHDLSGVLSATDIELHFKDVFLFLVKSKEHITKEVYIRNLFQYLTDFYSSGSVGRVSALDRIGELFYTKYPSLKRVIDLKERKLIHGFTFSDLVVSLQSVRYTLAKEIENYQLQYVEKYGIEKFQFVMRIFLEEYLKDNQISFYSLLSNRENSLLNFSRSLSSFIQERLDLSQTKKNLHNYFIYTMAAFLDSLSHDELRILKGSAWSDIQSVIPSKNEKFPQHIFAVLSSIYEKDESLLHNVKSKLKTAIRQNQTALAGHYQAVLDTFPHLKDEHRVMLSKTTGDKKSTQALLNVFTKTQSEPTTQQEYPSMTPKDQPGDIEESIFITNSGLVLLWPFLTGFLKRVKLIENKKFINLEARVKAAVILQYMVSGSKDYQEYLLALNKLFCNLGIGFPISHKVVLEDEIYEQCEAFLEAVKNQWSVMKNTSVQGFRESFLMRKGVLERQGNDWTLKVEQNSIDVLLTTLPWGFGMVKFPWNDYIISTEWN